MSGVVRRSERQRASLGFIGIHAGVRGGQAVSQSEILADRFSRDRYPVRQASTIRNPVLRTLHQLVSILSWRRVDALVIDVFSGRSFRMAEVATGVGRLRGLRLVLFLHGGNLPEFAPAHRRRVERVFRRADLILAPSEFLAGTFRRWGHDVRIIPNLVESDPGPTALRERARPRVLWMRTFHEHYDPITAVRAFARVAEQHPDARMTMGGADHGLLDATKDAARQLGVADRISFPGYLDTESKRTAFAEHDIFLNTNLVDNMPVSLVEASGAGLVPVATNVGGIPAVVVDGCNGVLVEPGDDVSIATAVMELLEDRERYAAISAGAREFAASSTWPEVRRRWEEELSLLLPGSVVR